VALIGKRKPAGVPQHVRMGLEGELGLPARTFNHAREPCGGEGRAPIRREHERRLRLLLALQPQCPQFVTDDRGRRQGALLDPANVQDSVAEIDLIPAHVRQLGCRDDKDHARTIGSTTAGAGPFGPAAEACHPPIISEIRGLWPPAKVPPRLNLHRQSATRCVPLERAFLRERRSLSRRSTARS
jgi:hypothetical protein